MPPTLEPIIDPDPEIPRPPKVPTGTRPTITQMIGGMPGTVIAILTAVTALTQAFQGYQESQAIQRSAYEALKVATDRNTEQLNRISQELTAGRTWMESIEKAVRELQARIPGEQQQMLAPPKLTPMLSAPPLPSFDQATKKD
jgi:hypothetical protein